jgi:hypothetical protein
MWSTIQLNRFTMHFDSPNDISEYLDEVVRQLREVGVSEKAGQLHSLLHESAFTTSSEWLGEIKLLLMNVRRSEREKFPSTLLQQIDAFIGFADETWAKANR